MVETDGAADEAEKDAQFPISAASALAAFRAAVLEVRALSKGREDDETVLQEAKCHLATAMRTATLAGVSQAELIEASEAPAETEEKPLSAGDRVEVFGLESESGKQLNGKEGVISHYIEDKGRFQVELGPDSFVSIRPTNLRRPMPEGGPAEAAEPSTGTGQAEEPTKSEEASTGTGQPEEELQFKIGERVEVRGLESESGMKLNGKVGLVSEYMADKGRFKVDISPTEQLSVKPANLVPRSPVRLPGEDSRSRSHSQSESSERSRSRSKKRKKKSMFSKAKKKKLSPEEKMEMLITGTNNKKFFEARAAAPKKEAQRSEGAAAAAAAMAELRPLDRVEVFGLQSETGKLLNGKIGIITKHLEEKGRFEVSLGMANTQSLKPENLRRIPESKPVGSEYSGPTAGYTLL
eukprot:gnl/TRDRNA2_/TRDRNA2_129251_c0_seq1.p1 gnl/TRDRNA2_/TRDRNA2_129251_c0~~gnl/TRDRNA2_/TRDRNA2_129251_c0_seq1.p1  ORF type:complete len:409 (-),score=78.32 gnl/TRDRNA2_/TRDRNA2_129251_c0_seq1:47-1273(-)